MYSVFIYMYCLNPHCHLQFWHFQYTLNLNLSGRMGGCFWELQVRPIPMEKIGSTICSMNFQRRRTWRLDMLPPFS